MALSIASIVQINKHGIETDHFLTINFRYSVPTCPQTLCLPCNRRLHQDAQAWNQPI